MKIRTLFAQKKQIREWQGNDVIAYTLYHPKIDEHHIILPYKANVKTRLHELAHCILGHCTHPPKYIGQYLKNEIEAEIWANEKCGKVVSLDALLNIAMQAIEWKEKPNFIFTNILSSLYNKGYVLNAQSRSNLWQGIRELKSLGDNI